MVVNLDSIRRNPKEGSKAEESYNYNLLWFGWVSSELLIDFEDEFMDIMNIYRVVSTFLSTLVLIKTYGEKHFVIRPRELGCFS